MSNGGDKVYRGRKFALTGGCLLIEFVALFADKISGAEVVALVPLTLAIFTGGNVAAKYAANGKTAETKVGQ